jgi:hypothetical protein
MLAGGHASKDAESISELRVANADGYHGVHVGQHPASHHPFNHFFLISRPEVAPHYSAPRQQIGHNASSHHARVRLLLEKSPVVSAGVSKIDMHKHADDARHSATGPRARTLQSPRCMT